MRTPRILLEDDLCAYHCISRVVGGQHLFTDQHKERIQQIILASAQLMGVNLINFVVMSNHVHILVRVPPSSSLKPLNRDSLLESVEVLYSAEYLRDLRQEFNRAAACSSPKTVAIQIQSILDRYEKRRANLSEFMKEVNQRITIYINKQTNRRGTLWEGRFKSPIVEISAEALLSVSTYIDLNPIRAAIVDRPEKYRWCGYSAALAGNRMLRDGLSSIFKADQGNHARVKWSKVDSDYRQKLFEKGIECSADPVTGAKARKGFSAKEVEEEILQRGKLPLHEVICHRVRYFTDGAIIGSASFVDRVFELKRDRLVSTKSRRQTGARKMRGAAWGDLTVLRDLRVNVIGYPP